ncbi:unnamed protein product [Ambrosiozyma monospora]|uniref:Unnamed protein product n=1 Tax=Ambrosiozyma monospora TaxID=43982 RepID=A0ACB5SVN4_AMBMO|nr:unnamed protein product [Ambrosiozyma monospora]
MTFTIWSYLTEDTENTEFIDKYDYDCEYGYEYDCKFKSYFPTRLFKRPLHFLYDLCDYDEWLDSILIRLIEELVFESCITGSPVFKDCVDYITGKSVKIHMISTRPIPGYVNTETHFFDSCCRELDAHYRWLMSIPKLNYVDHVTSLTCDLLFMEQLCRKIKLQDMIRLSELRIVMVF